MPTSHAVQLFQLMFNRQLQKAEDIIDRLEFRAVREDDELCDLAAGIFEYRVVQYLRGVGHPASSRGKLVSEEEWLAKQHCPAIRAQLLLKTMSDSLLLPTTPGWRLKVSFSLPDIRG